jgi:hypothetical protein
LFLLDDHTITNRDADQDFAPDLYAEAVMVQAWEINAEGKPVTARLLNGKEQPL